MSTPDSLKDSAAFCADLVRTHDFARYAATLFLPADQRRALLSIYAFNVEISRVRDQVSQPLPGEMRLQWWTDMLAGAGHGGVEGNPVAAELLQTISDFRLPVEPLSRLIEEHQFDLYNDPMPSMAALEGYVNDTSSALFSLGARVVAPPSEEIDHLARHAGLAQGMTAVIAALPLDAARRQLFVPLQLLESHGSGMEEVFSGKQTPQGARRDRPTRWRGQRPSEDGVVAAGERAAGGEAVVPAAGAGTTRPEADVTRGPRSVRAARHVAVSHAVDAVAGVAVVGVFVRPAAKPRRSISERAW